MSSLSPKYIVDLDKKPSERWIHILNQNKEALLNVKTQLLKNINLGNLYCVLSFMIKIYKFFGSIAFVEEIESIAKVMKTDFELVLILQLIYEASACCTSVITNVNNKQTFFRTMDWPMEFLKDVTIDVDFVKNDKVIYRATTWVGYVGILTATVPNKYSLSINYRRTKNMSFTGIFEKLYKLGTMNWPIGHLIRTICENDQNYDVALKNLCKADLISPCYITLCDASNIMKPVVITRNPHLFKIYENTFVVQTNCDQDKNEPDILFSLERRKKITKMIKQNNNKFKSNDELISKCYINPVINNETIYYAIMCPSTNTHYSVII